MIPAVRLKLSKASISTRSGPPRISEFQYDLRVTVCAEMRFEIVYVQFSVAFLCFAATAPVTDLMKMIKADAGPASSDGNTLQCRAHGTYVTMQHKDRGNDKAFCQVDLGLRHAR